MLKTDANALSILALDVGAKRIGVARALLAVGIANPLTTLTSPALFISDIAYLVRQEKAGAVVIGLPRGLDGQETEQTRAVRDFGEQLAQHLTVPIYWTDEALTSAKAEEELASRGKGFEKGDIDALAATYILEDFLHEQGVS
ncbi:MAG TPA: Holliday junction resolvase RuvX [Candidatus Limnocylindrales bacterium]|nr:Holliday junction resolvase RuvX [Candidatus Limnocylindrales bacterium]